MLVDIAGTKSKWFGESEKKIKEVFDNYRNYVENSEVAPILLFNEADGVIGKRIEFNSNSRTIDQTENSIQNIILQEIENLKGILIATTNLTQNLDKAFERRFLYKIEFSNPTIASRKAIWQAIIPELSDCEAQALASRYKFSGGQIENIARKRTVDSVISGVEPSLEKMFSYCNAELLNKDGMMGKIGFC
jgi:SpoVK/Ycf46/Vps4 family AAA+-type ATPase